MDFWIDLLGIRAPVVESEPTPVVEKKPEPKQAEKPKEPVVDLSKMTKAELLQYAEDKGIEVNARSKKADIILQLQK
jgi:hypothetical protein